MDDDLRNECGCRTCQRGRSTCSTTTWRCLLVEPLVQPEGDDWHYSLPVGTYWPLQWLVRKALEITKALAKPKKSLRSRDCWAALRSDLNSWLGRGLPGLGFALQEVATNLLQQLNLLDHPVSDGRVQSLGIVHLLGTEMLVKVGSSSLSTRDDCGLRNRLKAYRTEILASPRSSSSLA